MLDIALRLAEIITRGLPVARATRDERTLRAIAGLLYESYEVLDYSVALGTSLIREAHLLEASLVAQDYETAQFRLNDLRSIAAEQSQLLDEIREVFGDSMNWRVLVSGSDWLELNSLVGRKSWYLRRLSHLIDTYSPTLIASSFPELADMPVIVGDDGFNDWSATMQIRASEAHLPESQEGNGDAVLRIIRDYLATGAEARLLDLEGAVEMLRSTLIETFSTKEILLASAARKRKRLS